MGSETKTIYKSIPQSKIFEYKSNTKISTGFICNKLLQKKDLNE